MFKIDVRSNIRDVLKGMESIRRDQVPFATALALTRTAQDVKAAEVDEMRKVFDRPTPYALNSLFIKPATKSNLSAAVWVKDDVSKGTPAEKFILPEVEGGERRHKHFELALIRAGLMPSDMYAVPGDRIELDRYGNISGPLIEQILSALGAADTVSGHMSNRTMRSRKRRGPRPEYFVGRPGNGKGPLGIWQRVGRGARPIIIFVKHPAYRPRFNFWAIAERVTEARFKPNFATAYNQAIASRH